MSILLEKIAEVGSADFVFAFDHQMQIHWQIMMFLHRFLNSENVRKDLPFVVRSASRENIAILQNRLEWRRIPQLQRIRRLYVIMPLDQNCASARLMVVSRPNKRVAAPCDAPP